MPNYARYGYILLIEQAFYKMLKICIKWLIKPISAQLLFPRAFAYFKKVN